MNKQSKAYAIGLYIIWPFSSIFIGIKNFDSKFGKKLLVAAFAFLGFTANESGDLERYADRYYDISSYTFLEVVNLFLNLQIGKFFNDITIVLFAVFNNHHIYFAFLFSVFGYFLVNSISLLKFINFKNVNYLIFVSFIAFAFYFSISSVFNYAFYTGAIYFIYFLLKYILEKKKKYLAFIFLTPIFHIGLTPILIIPLVFILFKKKTKFYLILFFLFTLLSQSFIIKNLGERVSNSGQLIESKFDAYASDIGQERMNRRYSEGYQNGNVNYKILRIVRGFANKIALPVLLLILYFNRKRIEENDDLILDFLNVSIAALSVTNLMLNISQGERFFVISGFIILGLFVYCMQTKKYHILKYKPFVVICILAILCNNVVTLINAKNLVEPSSIFSNIPFYIINNFL